MDFSTFDFFKQVSSDACVVLTEEQTEELKGVLLEMLDDLIAVCEDNGIEYTLGGGSVLGAVRHGGIIPWDDDIDVNMTRENYTRFVPAFRQRFSDRYWLHTPEDTPGYELLFPRIRKKGTSVRTRDDFFHQEAGAFLDIFIIENTFNDPLRRLLHGFLCQATGLLLSCRKFYRARKLLLPLAGDNSKALAVFRAKIALGFTVSFLSVDTWRRIADDCCRMCRDGNSRLVVVPSGRKKFFGELCPREEICRTRMCPFDGRTCRIPAGSEQYLTRLYGDYHRIPPEGQREAHIFFRPFYLNSTQQPEGE